MFERVCKEDLLAEGDYQMVIADARLVLLVWPESGSVRAFQGVCPHTNTPLRDAAFDGSELVCPLHGWAWNMNTGEATHPDATSLAQYPLKIEDGVVYVDSADLAPNLAKP